MFYDDEVDGFEKTSGCFESDSSENKGGFWGKILKKIGSRPEIKMTNAPVVSQNVSVNGSLDELNDGENVVTGPAGKNATFRLTGEWDERTLEILGQGPMDDFEEEGTPWEEETYNVLEIIIEDGITAIGNHAFDGCGCLERIDIPDSVTRIGNSAFCSCHEIRSFSIPYSVTEIGDEAFFYCRGLTSVTIPKTVKKLGKDVFSSCEALETIRIEADIDRIPEGIAWGCEKLKEMWIPAVSEIDELAIGECPELKDIYYAGTKEQWESIKFDEDNDTFEGITIHFNA